MPDVVDDTGEDIGDDPRHEADDLERHYGAVGAHLRQPQIVMGLADFAREISWRRIHVRLAGLGPLVADPGLAGRVRGAFGQMLADAASPQARAGQPCPWQPPSAFEALFRKQGRMTPGTDFPSPWVLGLDAAGEDLLLSLTLFGIAGEWAPAAAESLTLALLWRVDWAASTGFAVPREIHILDRTFTAAHGVEAEPWSGGAENAVLEFLSPLVISGLSGNVLSALFSLRFRLEGLARFQGATLEPQDWPLLLDALHRCTATFDERQRVHWSRGSRRQDRRMAMAGVTGAIRLSGAAEDLSQLWPLLALGSLTHVGADVAFGCGRYQLYAS